MKNLIHSLLLASALVALPASAQMPAPAVATIAAPSFEVLAEKLLPTVVNVSTTAKISAPGGPGAQPLLPLPELPPGSPFEDFFKDFYEQYKNQQSDREQKVSALGSGFIVDAAKGYVVTNNHVIKDADEIKIVLHDDTTLDAKLIGTDDKTDIALLQVKSARGLQAIEWGDSDNAKVGSWVVAIGNPFGLGGTVTAGIVSARQRDINSGPYDDFIQTDASINRGNSGGPMFNLEGKVIGVNTAIFSPTGGSVGIGFAVPANIVKSVVDQLAKYGKTKRGWLGVRIQEVTPEIAESLSLPKVAGALVSSVTPKGPAEAAGVLPGDVILSFDGHELGQMKKLPRVVAEQEVGKTATLTLWRNGKEKTVNVVLGQLEKAEEEGLTDKTKPVAPDKKEGVPFVAIPELELSVTGLTQTLRDKYGIAKDTNGLLVTEVKKGGVAAEKGLAPGDILMEVDQKEVTTPELMKEKITTALKASRGSVLLFVERKEDRRFVAIKMKK